VKTLKEIADGVVRRPLFMSFPARAWRELNAAKPPPRVARGKTLYRGKNRRWRVLPDPEGKR
jgi:hypothetical protein